MTLHKIQFQECREYGQYIFENVTKPNPVLGEEAIVKKVDICAHKVVELIVGGDKAKEREFPHMVCIFMGFLVLGLVHK